jgi:hypothetical protein
MRLRLGRAPEEERSERSRAALRQAWQGAETDARPAAAIRRLPLDRAMVG